MELQQRAAGGGDQLTQFGVSFLDPLVDQFEFGDQVRGEPSTGFANDIALAYRRQQRTSLGCGQELLCASWQQFQQEPVELVHSLGSCASQLVAVIDQQAQGHAGAVNLHAV